jgi:hypothetical protein
MRSPALRKTSSLIFLLKINWESRKAYAMAPRPIGRKNLKILCATEKEWRVFTSCVRKYLARLNPSTDYEIDSLLQ